MHLNLLGISVPVVSIPYLHYGMIHSNTCDVIHNNTKHTPPPNNPRPWTIHWFLHSSASRRSFTAKPLPFFSSLSRASIDASFVQYVPLDQKIFQFMSQTWFWFRISLFFSISPLPEGVLPQNHCLSFLPREKELHHLINLPGSLRVFQLQSEAVLKMGDGKLWVDQA